MVALSDPGSEQAQYAKIGVSNSISLQRILAVSSVVPLQTVKVLEELFRLIFKREMEAMLDGPPLNLDTGKVTSNSPQHERKIHGLALQPEQYQAPVRASQTVVVDPLQSSRDFGEIEPQVTEMRPRKA
ncbi:hypothetical protein SBOR_4457 [Sclerotinia borealis F-4128]|uniref:Uncharacterized protein n=1 Tax=Sclerotinia borealis (strain F-4128) TaxID=1432307 RepID=W9CEG6_SCLBF|nr:hypothetical protein SBOR_4457 [Sclerotinia borealis F-4128]